MHVSWIYRSGDVLHEQKHNPMPQKIKKESSGFQEMLDDAIRKEKKKSEK